MQLQYVMANPIAKKKKKARKKVHKKHKKAKIDKVGGNPVAKFKKGSAAAKRFMAKPRAKRHKKHKSKQNPKGRHNAEGYYLVPKKPKAPKKPRVKIPEGFTKKKFRYPDEEVVLEKELFFRDTRDNFKKDFEKLKQLSAAELLLSQGSTLASARKMRKKLAQATKAYEKKKKARDLGKAKDKEVEAAGGQVIITKGNASMKRRKKAKRKHARKHKRNPVVRMKQVANPKKKAKRSKRRGRKKAHKAAKHLVKMVGTARLSKKAAKSIARRKRLHVAVAIRNPIDIQSLAVTSLWLAGGYVAAGMIFKIADGLAKGQISSAASALGAFKAPVVGIALGVAAQMVAERIPGQAGRITHKLGHGAIVAGGVIAGLAAIDMAMVYAKQTFPQIATLPVIGPAFAGVRFFPNTMAGADFGMYPQMGQYHQQPGDFGVIPAGLRGADFGVIPQGMRGVEYFPNRGMSGVEFFPDGSIGDEMYKQSEQDDIAEAHGLGVIPAGLGGADFGEAEGQLG